MEQNTLDEIREIKKSLRLAMNGVVSTLQRRQGLDYKINFGVEIPRLKGIAEAHKENEELAAALWQENIRECKILAIYLMPEHSFVEVADRWVGEVKFTEIADQLAMHRLCRLPNAWDKALEWIATSDAMYRYCGYLTISHLVRRGVAASDEQERAFFKSIINIESVEKQSPTTGCALNAIMNYLDSSPLATERLKKAITANCTTPASLAALLENYG
ncbi:MAG: DNA alkylation repair protein [Bacteroidaceae bacterium]|nr:DNA alkylation repair protein [Bacteroidaceae bacterium]